MRSTRAPQGQRAPSPGQVSEANDTLGYADGFPMRPRRGQKQRQKRSCHGFCPLRGRIVCTSTKPRVSLAALACPGLGACCPFGARVERLSPIGKNPPPEPKTNPGFEFSVGGTGFSKPGFEISIGGVVRPGGGSRGERFTFRGKQTARASWHRALRAGPHTA